MDKEDIEKAMQKILHESEEFRECPTYQLALELDKDISILRYMIGEDNFLTMHYFRRMHEDAIKYMDEQDKVK